MNPVIRNILAVIAGAVSGSIVNMGIITVSGSIIPPPDGIDVTTMEGLKAALPLFGPQHFIFPFLAHALGTLAGAFVAAWIAVSQKMKFAIGVSGLFLFGGIANVFMLPAPLWFCIVDVAGAYLPFGYLAGKIAEKNS